MPILPGYMGLHLLSGLRRDHRLPDKEIMMINKLFVFTITVIGEAGPIPVFPNRSNTSAASTDIWHFFDIEIDIVTLSSMYCVATSLFKVVARLARETNVCACSKKLELLTFFF